MSSPPIQWLARPDGSRIAYRAVPGRSPGLAFLGGFRSDMSGTKATALEEWARERGQAFLRFDYLGHGESSGAFEEGTIGRWTEDALAVCDATSTGPLLLVGSSMGAWIMLLVALARPERVVGLVGVAAAPDFTEELIWRRQPEEQRERLRREGQLEQPAEDDLGPYAITYRLVEEARAHLLLGGPIGIRCPVRLLHGLDDSSVPWQTALQLARNLESDDVELCLVKDGDHRLSRPRDLVRLGEVVARLLEDVVGRRGSARSGSTINE